MKPSSISPPVPKPWGRSNRSSTTAIITVAVVCSLVIMLFNVPHYWTFRTTLRYPKCDHIVLVSVQRHGSTWFISNAEDCVSVNGSYGELNRNVEIWHHGIVRRITVENAIDLVRFKTSVKIFPQALYEHGDDVRAFFEAIRELQIPVFVLRRNLENSYASLHAARKTNSWTQDHGGAGLERDIELGKKFVAYKNRTETFFEDVKKLMGDIGIAWDEVQYETILSHRVILGKTAMCYIRNCNFK